jgi:hypothetical protein
MCGTWLGILVSSCMKGGAKLASLYRLVVGSLFL